MSSWQKKYRWERTWGDETGINGEKHEDYAGFDGEDYIGRIRFEATGPTKDLWQWTGARPSPFRAEPIMPLAGYCKTAAEAAQTVERYWDQMKARIEKGPEVRLGPRGDERLARDG